MRESCQNYKDIYITTRYIKPMNVRIQHYEEGTPSPAHRSGPRPLGLYYALMQPLMTQTIQSPLFTAETKKTLEEAPLSHFLKGVKRYHNAPWFREETAPEIVWQKGRVKVFHYPHTHTYKSTILLIPSMINKSYIYNLAPGHSLIEHLCNDGYSVQLMDWSEPTSTPTPEPSPKPTEAESISVESSITDYILPYLNSLKEPVHLGGYCMGGLLALAAAQLSGAQQTPSKVKSLSLFATPWDFSKTEAHSQMVKARMAYEMMVKALPIIPVDILQTQFVMLAPMATINRFCHYYDTADENSLKLMTLMEDWLADGVPVEQSVAHTVAINWFIKNVTVNKQWRVNGEIIHPENITCPTFIAMPEKDILVPPASCATLAETQSGGHIHKVKTGHIGLMVGRKCHETFFKPYSAWLDHLTD